MKKDISIAVFEHETIRLNQVIDGNIVDALMLESLRNHYGDSGVPYFSLTNNGIRFNEYVGVIQAGNFQVQVLPKADKQELGKESWKKVLLGMLKKVFSIQLKNAGNSQLSLHSNSILDLYFELFLNEIEYLLHKGLIKKYRKTEGNVSALKGALVFGKQIQQNIVHQERFYTRHTIYDAEHLLHKILYQALLLLKQINHNSVLQSRIATALLWFPEMPSLKVNQLHFNKIQFTRKTEGYRTAMEIARLLLLNYHPDINKGRNDLIALMFDMNRLWEKFIYVSLIPLNREGFSVVDQFPQGFWESDKIGKVGIIPDIVISKDKQNYVLDTKWKNLNGQKPSSDDLQQMFTYHEFFKAQKVALIYPGKVISSQQGITGFYKSEHLTTSHSRECSLIPIDVNEQISNWQEQIKTVIKEWCIGKAQQITS